MTDRTDATEGAWFAGLDPGDREGASAAIADGRADGPENWPERAVEAGYAETDEQYYDRLREATLAAARREVRERESADDQQLIHAVRAMDDARRTANELAERVAEWAGSRYPDAETGVAGARAIAEGRIGTGDETEGRTESRDEAGEGLDERVRSLAARVRDLDDEAEDLRTAVERTAPSVAPNLSSLAGPVLAARLIALAGGLGDLAKQPSGTVQVLGAEDALFAHLRGTAPSPKHGVIYTHDAVRGTHPDHRGSAARALAGKLAIAARVDHYSGDRRPEIEREFAERIATIRARTGDEWAPAEDSAGSQDADDDEDRPGGADA